MNSTQDKIYQYFERDPQLRVLFIFNDEATGSLLNTIWTMTGSMIR